MAERKSPALYYAVILVVCFFAFFVNNHVIPADLMESRNLATAQEMVREGNYLVPTMNGELRLEKPPLPTWIAAGVENVIPGNLVAQRCAAGLAATFLVIFTFLISSRLTRNRNIGLLAALVLAGCFNVVLMGRTATWDIYCHCFMAGAIFFFVRGFGEEGHRWGDFFWSGTFMGLSFLSKGPVSFFALLLPFLISYFPAFRPKWRGKGGPLALLVAVMVLVSFWWPVYLVLFHPETAVAVAGKESTAWLTHNVRPFWYYWQFPAEAGIWALFWVTAIIYFFTRRELRANRRFFSFSMLWLVAALVLLSLVPEKKTRYLLPVLIPGAMNVAMYFWYIIKFGMNRSDKVLFRINGFVIALILLIVPAGLYFGFVNEGLMTWPHYILTAAVSLFLAIYIIASMFRNGRINAKRVFGGVVAAMVMIEALCLGAVGHMFINGDRHSIRMLREQAAVENMQFYHDRNEFLRMELVYEANSRIFPLDLSDEELVFSKLPFVLLSTESADTLLRGMPVRLEHIDTYDNNWRKRDHKRYNWELVKHATVVTEAAETNDDATENPGPGDDGQ